jgi:hypothetical protein
LNKIAQWLIWGFFGAIALGIVFVKAGQKGGRSGGQQSADIITAGASGLASTASALEGG